MTTSIVQELADEGLVSPPDFVLGSVQYETIVGSVAYGVSTDASDMDVYGFCIPPKEVVFPHLAGVIPGFGRQVKRFDQYQQAHIDRPGTEQVYDLAIFNIVRYFHLCMENNPNMIDSLFTPERCVLHATEVGKMVKARRKLFLHRGSWPKFKGYAYSQMQKMYGKKGGEKRQALADKFGFDVKFAYHAVRLLCEAEMILTEGDLDLERHRDHLKAIREGAYSEEEVRAWLAENEARLDGVYEESTLPWGPDEAAIKSLMLECLEQHYGSLSGEAP